VSARGTSFLGTPHPDGPRGQHEHAVCFLTALHDLGAGLRGNDEALLRHVLEQISDVDVHNRDK
jgi:hypothetical protein